MKKLLTIILAFPVVAFADTAIQSDTHSTAEQAVGVSNAVNIGGTPADQTIHYEGSYTTKSAPTVYAPGLTASMNETCWGSVSGSISAVGVGVAGGATVKDESCNRRLTASVSWKMGRQDIAYNVMCQEPVFYDAALDTDKPCPVRYAPVPKDKRNEDFYGQ